MCWTHNIINGVWCCVTGCLFAIAHKGTYVGAVLVKVWSTISIVKSHRWWMWSYFIRNDKLFDQVMAESLFCAWNTRTHYGLIRLWLIVGLFDSGNNDYWRLRYVCVIWIWLLSTGDKLFVWNRPISNDKYL